METKLEKIIKERGLKKGFIAEKAGLSRSAFSLVCSGKSVPTLLAAIRIARVLNTTVEELWGNLIEHD
ncbi:helix-turn-helix domain-containing protein [Bacillus sp. B15-48]|uniref:helix-turn-helix transcriptional regulator n=1 Tax=Bacillus sp. B15-48 TaxID=1548601 RepID=UPI00193EE175|nr:helix-turn-helix domain-containing protein [Bacillus sp. B15-48]MBM4762691.1 helix-turn-helix domain-containing protein [Bacillus sp. B15-48]